MGARIFNKKSQELLGNCNQLTVHKPINSTAGNCSTSGEQKVEVKLYFQVITPMMQMSERNEAYSFFTQ